MLLGTLGASLLGILLTGKGSTKSTNQERVINKKGKGVLRTGYGNKENL